MLESLSAILFDLDDTLMVEWNSARDSIVESIALLSEPVNEDKFVQIIIEEARVLWHAQPVYGYCKNIGISSWEALWADFDGNDKNLEFLRKYAADYRINSWMNALKKFHIDDKNTALRLSEYYKSIRNTKHFLFPDTRKILEKLKGNYSLGLITNGTPDLQWKKIKGGKLENYFDAIVISGETGTGKPDPVIFNELLKRLNCNAQNSIMIGDSLNTDIEGAKNAGITTIWLNRNGKVIKDSLLIPDFEIKNLPELFNLL